MEIDKATNITLAIGVCVAMAWVARGVFLEWKHRQALKASIVQCDVHMSYEGLSRFHTSNLEKMLILKGCALINP